MCVREIRTGDDVTSGAGSTLTTAELKKHGTHSRDVSRVLTYIQNRTRDVALAFGVLWYLGYCEYPTIGRFGGPKTDPTKTWYPGPQTVPIAGKRGLGKLSCSRVGRGEGCIQ
jgi:hypothetical protein